MYKCCNQLIELSWAIGFQGFQVKHESIVLYQFQYVKAWLYHTYKWKMYSYCMRNLIENSDKAVELIIYAVVCCLIKT